MLVLLENIASFISSAAVMLAAIVAVIGLTTWRNEIRARRRAEIAENTLAMFYQARDVIAAARSPAGYRGEGASRPKAPMEAEDETNYKNAVYAPVERLARTAEFWGRMEAARYPFMAVFGEAAAKPFDTVRQIKHRIEVSAGMLVRTYGRPGGDRDDLQRQTERWEDAIGWLSSEVDEIAREIDVAISAIEKVCRPAIDAHER